MRRPLLTVAGIYSLGLVLGDRLPLPLGPLLLLSLAVAGLALAFDRTRCWLLGPLLLLAGWSNLTLHTAVLSPLDLRTRLGTNAAIVTVRGTLIEAPSERVLKRGAKEMSRTLARLRVTAVAFDSAWQPVTGEIITHTRGVLSAGFHPGATVEISGVIRNARGASADGLFDYDSHLRRLGIYHQLEIESDRDWRRIDSAAERPPVTERFRLWAQRTLAHGLPQEDESLRLLWAMALGWTTALTSEVSEPFMHTGTMHIFAISGLHIALIAGILVALLRVLRISRGLCGWVVIPLIWFYTAATGWQASAVRSTIMMTIIILGWSLRRPSDLLNSLAGAGFLILLWDPRQLFQAGFQLSFLVVLSIALVLPPLEVLRRRVLRTDPFLPAELLPRWRRWLDAPIRHLTGGLATSLAAWLGSIPLIALYFHLFTPVSLLANLLIVPLSSLALASNLGSLLCAWWPWLSELFNFSGWFWMKAMIRLSDWFAGLPGASFNLPSPSWPLFLAYYGLLFGTMTGWLLAPGRRKWTASGIAALAAFAILQWSLHRKDVCLTVLPLNGGDSIFVDAAGRGNDLLIDCGNEFAAELVVNPFLRAQGVNHLSRLLMTHGDLRHVGGASTVEQAFGLDQILTSGVPFRSGKYRELRNARSHSPDRRREINRGDRIADWLVLHPAAGDHFRDADDNALVLRGALHGIRILLASDLGRPGQNTLLEREADLRADVVVCGIPVHGEPLGEPLLDAVQPRVIIVSAGEVPVQERASRELRERLERRGIPVFYTSDDGAVTITAGPSGGEVRGRSGKRVSLGGHRSADATTTGN